MNCTTANHIPLTHVLSYHYQLHGNVKGNSIWYSSPFSEDKTPSFKVRRDKNDWIDFSTGKKGTVIDLVCELSGVSVPGALLILSGMNTANNNFSFFEKQSHVKKETPSLKINHIQPLHNRALIQYLKSRKIPYQVAANIPQLKEAYYTNNDKQYFALAFENDSNGYELRSKYFKGCTKKDITTIPGKGNSLNLFEGFFDYLSALTCFDERSCNTTIVLNSLVNLDKVDLTRYDKINLFLDNDKSGIKTATDIIQKHPGAVNRSQQFYRFCKDFNEYLLTI